VFGLVIEGFIVLGQVVCNNSMMHGIVDQNCEATKGNI
jgi:hypothetical protein